jgi:putative AlgH/UPF0301 family transcriptional regulator
MPKQKKKQKHKIEGVQPGCILLAQPFWEDEAFNRAVILITDKYKRENTEEELIYRGIIVNKQSTVSIGEALPELSGRTERIYFGGKTSAKMITYTHCISEIPEADDLGNGILHGGDPMALSEMIKEDKIDFKKILFCAGIVEWTEEMLKEEFDDERWWIGSITAEELFNQKPETLWSFKLLSAGHMYGLFAHIPDPTLEERAGKNVKIE